MKTLPYTVLKTFLSQPTLASGTHAIVCRGFETMRRVLYTNIDRKQVKVEHVSSQMIANGMIKLPSVRPPDACWMVKVAEMWMDRIKVSSDTE